MSTRNETAALGCNREAAHDHEKPNHEFTEKSLPKSTLERFPGESAEHFAAIRFCLGNTARQIADSVVEAHIRGLRPPTEEERERVRLDAALYLAQSADPSGRAIARDYLRRQLRVA